MAKDGNTNKGQLKFNGRGILICASGNRYEGEFKDDKLICQGRKTADELGPNNVTAPHSSIKMLSGKSHNK